jgi:hypothetical protein
LIEPGVAYLNEQCIQSLREYGFDDLFERPEFVTWTLSEEFLQLQSILYSNNEIRVSKRAKIGLASTDVTDMYLYDFVKPLGDISQKENGRLKLIESSLILKMIYFCVKIKMKLMNFQLVVKY